MPLDSIDVLAKADWLSLFSTSDLGVVFMVASKLTGSFEDSLHYGLDQAS